MFLSQIFSCWTILACWMLEMLLEQLLHRAGASPNPTSPSFPSLGREAGSAAELSKMRIFSHTEVIAARRARAEI